MKYADLCSAMLYVLQILVLTDLLHGFCCKYYWHDVCFNSTSHLGNLLCCNYSELM